MDRDAEEFETFLRQFQPSRPRPLPTRRRVVVAMRVSWSGADAESPQSTAAPIEAGAEQTNRPDDGRGVQDPVAQPQGENPPVDAPQSTPALEFRPALGLSGSPDRDEAFESLAATAQQGGRLRVGGAIRPPMKVFDVRPVYPDEAQTAGVQGTVILDIVIGEDGSVIEADVVRSIRLLDQAALDAVIQWLFEPTLINGEPVEVAMNVTVQFTLSQ